MSFSIASVRWRPVIGAVFAVIVVSFLIPITIVTGYAFVLAFQARGAPDQTAIHHFAASVSRKLMPWIEALLTFLFAIKVARNVKEARMLNGLAVGILSGLLSSAVILFFGGRIGSHTIVLLLVLVALGWTGGFIGQKTGASAH